MSNKKVLFKRIHSEAIMPKYQTELSSGFDLHSVESTTLEPFSRKLISTGLQLAYLDPSLEIQIRPRSGLALKSGLTVLNSPGTIDADYRGEIKVILYNTSNEKVHINKGDRIAQAVITQVERVNIAETSTIDETSRGSEGFGSTGK